MLIRSSRYRSAPCAFQSHKQYTDFRGVATRWILILILILCCCSFWFLFDIDSHSDTDTHTDTDTLTHTHTHSDLMLILICVIAQSVIGCLIWYYATSTCIMLPTAFKCLPCLIFLWFYLSFLISPCCSILYSTFASYFLLLILTLYSSPLLFSRYSTSLFSSPLLPFPSLPFSPSYSPHLILLPFPFLSPLLSSPLLPSPFLPLSFPKGTIKIANRPRLYQAGPAPLKCIKSAADLQFVWDGLGIYEDEDLNEVWHHVISCHIVTWNVMLYHVMLYHVMTHCITCYRMVVRSMFVLILSHDMKR